MCLQGCLGLVCLNRVTFKLVSSTMQTAQHWSNLLLSLWCLLRLVWDEVCKCTSKSIFNITMVLLNYVNFFQGLVETCDRSIFHTKKELYKNITWRYLLNKQGEPKQYKNLQCYMWTTTYLTYMVFQRWHDNLQYSGTVKQKCLSSQCFCCSIII